MSEAVKLIPDDAVPLHVDTDPAADKEPKFKANPDGIYWLNLSSKERKYEWLCPPLDILGRTRNADGSDWGRYVSFLDADGKRHTLTITMADLARDGGSDVIVTLAREGFKVPLDIKRKRLLAEYLCDFPTNKRLRAASQVGWHGKAFVMPDATYGGSDDEGTVFQPEGQGAQPYATRGALEEWQTEVAARAAGNSRLVFGLSAAFAGPLLKPLTEESGGVHLRGPSSCGKTTVLHVAASVWGKTIRSWRATDNAQEWVASLHCDTFLAMDELGQADGRTAGATAYMIANGHGKARANRSGGARPVREWRTIFLSSGEVSLADKIAEDGRGRSSKAGQEVRVLDVPADAGADFGAFETLHGTGGPGAFADALKRATGDSYGTAGPAFIKKLVSEDMDALRAEWPGFKESFTDKGLSGVTTPDGQVTRAASRFALIAFAGELATRFGILPWMAGDAAKAALRCFDDWLQARGGVGSVEARQVIERVQRACLIQRAQFQRWDGEDVPWDRLGFVREDAGDQDGFYLHSAAFRQVLAGLNEKHALGVLDDAGLLKTDKDGRKKRKVRLSRTSSTERMVHIRPAITKWEG